MSRNHRHQHDLAKRFEHTNAKPAFCSDCGYRLDSEEHGQLCNPEPEPAKPRRGWPFVD
jgi:hypothetical protein